MRASQTVVALVAATAVTVAGVRVADACGCLSPPAPVGDEDYAVNQQSEQIIFEVEPNWVTAHVLIKYAGAPESFAWLVPVPEAPELGISPVSAFGLLDRDSAPEVSVRVDNLCPVSEWQCQFHGTPSCGGSDDDGFPGAVLDAAAGFSDAAPTGGMPPVEVIDEQIVGDYQTVTFRASEAAAASQWLRDNGFIVNPTTALYMEPYVEANMVFVAAKLVPGAGVDAIKPLRMRYRAPFPMIPLVLTAVAAEPHLTVTAFIYGSQPFRPMSHPVVTIDPARLARDGAGRLNYPMVLARTIDEAGGDGFAIEYRGAAPRPRFGGTTNCCDGMFDFCNVGDNTTCECPRDDFDRADCAARGDLLDGVALLDTLATAHPYLTRLTTRISPEEMRFDPTFEPSPVTADGGLFGRRTLAGQQASLDGCWGRVVDRAQLDEIEAKQACAATYCGAGQCVATDSGPACACDAGHVARRFVDVDGAPSVTCIPATAPVDLAAGGLVLPDACAGVDCGMGRCADRNGVAVCACNGAAAAITGAGPAPRCEPVVQLTHTPGGEDFSAALADLQVCAPPPPSCGADGWLVRVGSPRVGLDCGDATPTPAQLEEPPPPVCADDSRPIYGCGCQSGHPAGALALAWIVGFLLLRRRRAA